MTSNQQYIFRHIYLKLIKILQKKVIYVLVKTGIKLMIQFFNKQLTGLQKLLKIVYITFLVFKSKCANTNQSSVGEKEKRQIL